MNIYLADKGDHWSYLKLQEFSNMSSRNVFVTTNVVDLHLARNQSQ